MLSNSKAIFNRISYINITFEYSSLNHIFSIQRSSLLSEHLNIKFVRGCREDDQSIVIPKFEAAWPTSLSRLWSSEKWEWGEQWGMRMREKEENKEDNNLKTWLSMKNEEWERNAETTKIKTWLRKRGNPFGENKEKAQNMNKTEQRGWEHWWGRQRSMDEHQHEVKMNECWFLTRADPTSL